MTSEFGIVPYEAEFEDELEEEVRHRSNEDPLSDLSSAYDTYDRREGAEVEIEIL